MKSKILMFGALCLGALTLYACGGGSYSAMSYYNYNAFLSGNYQVNQVGDAGASAVTETVRVDMSADGAGAGMADFSSANHSTGVAGSGAYSYTVAADRTFSVTTTTGTVHGIVSAAGSPFVLTDTNRTVSAVPPEDAGVVMAVGIKKSSGLTNAILNGSYQIHQAGDALLGAGLYTARVDVTADGAGAGTWTIAGHSAGASGTGAYTYSVNATDGTFSMTTAAGTDYGIVSADGSMFALTDTNPPADTDAEIVMAVGMRKSSGLTNAVLNGNYQIHQVGKGAAGRYTSRVNITADGLGGGTWSIASHSAGDMGSGLFTYSVASDGTFSVTTKDATGTVTIGTDYGIVSADGSLFAITDTNPVASAMPPIEDAEIIMAVGVKK